MREGDLLCMEPAQEVVIPSRDPFTVQATLDALLTTLSDPQAWGFATHSSGGIEDSFLVQAAPNGDRTTIEITNSAPHFAFLLEGTGRYGKGAYIQPRRRQALAFSGRNGTVFAATSRGVNPAAAGPKRVNVPSTYESLLNAAMPDLIA